MDFDRTCMFCGGREAAPDLAPTPEALAANPAGALFKMSGTFAMVGVCASCQAKSAMGEEIRPSWMIKLSKTGPPAPRKVWVYRKPCGCIRQTTYTFDGSHPHAHYTAKELDSVARLHGTSDCTLTEEWEADADRVTCPAHWSDADQAEEDLIWLLKRMHVLGVANCVDDFKWSFGYGVDYENSIFAMIPDYQGCSCPGAADWEHDPGCRMAKEVEQGNFLHKPSWSTVRWYKYIGREMETDLKAPWSQIIAECFASIGDAANTPRDRREQRA